MEKLNFHYSVRLDFLKKRAEFLRKIRSFFADREVLEVETPLLAHAPVSDPYIDAIETLGVRGYLQTSPEYAMKRLLAMGIGSCFQLCKAFRIDPISPLHNPEFTLLEWYRLDFNDQDLMQEVDSLFQTLLSCPPAHRLTYEEAFLKYLNISALHTSSDVLKSLFIQKFGPIPHSENFTIDDWRMLLFSHGIEPALTGNAPYFIYDFPASQAALARLKTPEVAARFEVYMNGIELGNGYHELQDARFQKIRFEQDLALRKQLNKMLVPLDEHLLEAMKAGLPNCAGIAIGIDRLLMIAFDVKHIQEVAVI